MIFSVCQIIFSVIFLILTIFYAYFKFKYIFYWSRRGIPFVRPEFPFGNIQNLHGKEHFCLFIQKYYIEFKEREKYFGLFYYSTPAVVITNRKLIETILKRDHSKFNDRSLYHNQRDDPLSGHLVLLSGTNAKRVRSLISPAFTPNRMKDMFSTIVEVSNRLNDYLNRILDENNEVDIGDLLTRYTIDVIGASAFGIECNSLEDPDNEFRSMCERGLSKPRHGPELQFFLNYHQNLGRFFGIKLIRDDVSNYFLGIILKAIESREEQNIRRRDFLGVLIEIKKNFGSNSDELTTYELAAQAFAFFTPGFDTMSSATIFMLYEMAQNRRVQERARSEIKDVLRNCDGDLTYENISNMTYIDKIISETLRKYPPFTMLRRIAVEDYQVPGTDQIIEKGTPVIIPVFAIHYDPEYFAEPHKFEPDRFVTDEAKKANLAFGLGSRNCIGIRFSRMQLSIALITFLKNFEITTCDQTVSPMVFKPCSLRLTPKSKVYLKLNKL